MTVWITIILIIITLLAILYTIFKKCRYVSSLPRVCFPLYPFSTILRGTSRTDIFIEVVNLASAEAMWAHFASVAVHPSQLRITGYPCAYDMHIIKLCCCRQLQIDWQNIVLCDLDQNIIKLPALGKISLWSTNDLESIETNIPYQIRKSSGFGYTPRNQRRCSHYRSQTLLSCRQSCNSKALLYIYCALKCIINVKNIFIVTSA